jgi:hypothetical protein
VGGGFGRSLGARHAGVKCPRLPYQIADLARRQGAGVAVVLAPAAGAEAIAQRRGAPAVQARRAPGHAHEPGHLHRHAGADVEAVVAQGELVEDYPDDTPFPSRLLLGAPGGRPLHVVAADEPGTDVTYIVTAYYPDPAQWDADFRRRRT